MTTFVLINNLSDLSGEQDSPKKLVKKRLSGQKISGLFFYSKAVKELLNEARLNEWLEYSLSEGISLYVCRNSLIKRNISEEIDPAINVVGLGQLIEGVLKNKKTIVIGNL
jgi:intracellular sulfur oxidation DsrE/DsrF family protein